MSSAHLKRSNPAVHAFSTYLPWSYHQLRMTRFYIDSRGEIGAESVDFDE